MAEEKIKLAREALYIGTVFTVCDIKLVIMGTNSASSFLDLLHSTTHCSCITGFNPPYSLVGENIILFIQEGCNHTTLVS